MGGGHFRCRTFGADRSRSAVRVADARGVLECGESSPLCDSSRLVGCAAQARSASAGTGGAHDSAADTEITDASRKNCGARTRTTQSGENSPHSKVLRAFEGFRCPAARTAGFNLLRRKAERLALRDPICRTFGASQSRLKPAVRAALPSHRCCRKPNANCILHREKRFALSSSQHRIALLP
jgi:hypothetical protein